jgi:hypothetical protein
MSAPAAGSDRAGAALQPGRTCPLHYRYEPAALAREADVRADALYVAGGLYGNPYALERILDLADGEPQRPVLVFNGDFNWFDVEPAVFADINRRVLQHVALRGNVETELAADEDAGCGCGYPEDVSDAEVDRSNAILRRLRETARAFADIRTRLSLLPMHVVADVAGVRIAIVHGDAESLAGWAYSAHALSRPEGVQRLREHFQRSHARVIASTHTCLPVALTAKTTDGTCALFNNGAAGMPNFRGTRYGIITRIAPRPHPHALYGVRIAGLHVEALAVHYDHVRWLECLLESWPPGSPAHASYIERIVEGPAYDRLVATRGAVRHGPLRHS